MTEIINLTPHPITVLDHDGSLIREIPPSGQVARLTAERQDAGDLAGIPLGITTYGDNAEMPEPREGVRYVVSLVTALALAGSDRDDLLVVDQEVRDGTGRIIGCRGLAVPRARPARHAELEEIREVYEMGLTEIAGTRSLRAAHRMRNIARGVLAIARRPNP
ncbi:hypothetical protein [Streptomyces sp. ST2-7A]|uniref:hypothetical protein n=1 Tax=Streptomyces sp. ST2-7A TaxID=2907214 RepID=UPI001F1766CE|nr:hypothetical protein [Streptomyces sp. ST2-7A]MCE7081139.1 hypothetical protein [Streptomyces sp. ST2-7A]